MNFNIFTLHPNIFESFFANSLIARGLEKKVFEYDLINWRENFGLDSYKQVDEKPFGGGSGMILMAEPIYRALESVGGISNLFEQPKVETTHQRIYPNNSGFYNLWKSNPEEIKSVTVNLTPRGFTLNQKTVEWLASNFEKINLLCGRYEGFDARVSEVVDLEISLGGFVLGGGEVAAMALIESVTRLLPSFLVKETSALHDSFSSQLNFYVEQQEYVLGKRNFSKENETKKPMKLEVANSTFSRKNNNQKLISYVSKNHTNLFDNQLWQENILPRIEHPQYTRPETWQNFGVPKILKSGNHKEIQEWRLKGWREPTK